MTAETTPVAPDAALHRELTQERIQSARRINLVRFWGVSVFFALFLLLGGVLQLPAWTGNLGIFAVYWVITAVVFGLSRLERVAPYTTLAVALVDMPMVFFLQWATLPTSPSASGVAGFTVGVYVLLVILAALSLQNWYIWCTAGVGAGYEVLLQYLADVSVGGMVSTVLLLGLAAASCSYARTRLVELVGRVDRDIAKQRQAEGALRQAERMASLGTLAAGVAHEINTPLTYVVTNLALISERLPTLGTGDAAAGAGGALAERVAALEDLVSQARAACDQLVYGFAAQLSDELRHEFNNAQQLIVYALGRLADELAVLAQGGSVARAATPSGPPLAQIDRLLRQARDGADRVRTIMRDLKTFSRPDEPTTTPVDVWRVLEWSINLASSEIHHRARLTTEREPVPLVMANEARLGQVFVNLLVNAAQAIPEGAVAMNEIRVTTRTDERGRALVEVRDTGSGIAPEILGQLFDPFFTTKPVGEGTGLGLSICHGIVTALGGELTVESELRRGTTFRVALPAAAADGYAAVRSVGPVADDRAIDPAHAPVAPPIPAPTARRGRILVIDDDPHIGDAIRESLAREHDVVTVTSAAAALRLIELGEPFDLILCDLMMPTMTGMELHDELARREPALAARMSFLTGGAFTPRARAFLAEVPNPRLEKPFDPQGLRNFVRALVEAPPTTTEVTS
jgi:signal transduction histidine kinase